MDESPPRLLQAFGRLIRVAMLMALVGLVVDFGFPLGDTSRSWIRGGQIVAVALFAANVILKLVLAGERIARARRNWLELTLLALLFLDLALGTTLTGGGGVLTGVWFHGIQVYLVLRLLLGVAHVQEWLTQRAVRPALLLWGSFMVAALAGTGLIMLPLSRAEGVEPWSFTDAFFTATSAVCVTGLTVRDIGHDLSFRGQALLLGMIQIGGLGIVALACGAAAMHRGRFKLRELTVVSEALGISTPGRVRRFLAFLLTFTVACEVLGALSLWFATEDVDLLGKSRPWWCVFHSVSAFCNAGFGLSPLSLMPWNDQPWIVMTVAVLIVLGGLGFAVHMDVFGLQLFSRDTLRWIRWRLSESPWWPWRHKVFEIPVPPRLTLNSRIVLTATVILIAAGAVLFFGAETNRSLAGGSGGQRWMTSLFQSVTARTAGFNTVDVAGLQLPTLLLLMVLMAIGASPLSTGGGMRTITVAVVFLSVRAMLRNRESVEAFGRSISRPVVHACISIVAMYASALTLLMAALLWTQENLAFQDVLFESVSALSTVGLSTGITPQLDEGGRWIVSVAMIVGRAGPLAVLWSFVARPKPLHYRYPEEQVVVA